MVTNIRIVIGGNFGDEGKGLMTASFADEMMARSGCCLNVLSNGGPQRGHTVVRGQVRHVFRHFGSGTFAGADSYFPSQFLVNPMIFVKELEELKGKLPSGNSFPKVFIHPDCLVTTPYEMMTNLILEEQRGAKRHGSVGVGIWETLIGGGKSFAQLAAMEEKQREEYLARDRREHLMTRLAENGIGQLPDAWKEIVYDPAVIRQYLEDFALMREMVHITDDAVLKAYPEILFENGQGLLLDTGMKYKGYGNHTTPSNTGIENPARIVSSAFGLKHTVPSVSRQEQQRVDHEEKAEGQDIKLHTQAVYVTRSYMTRHGAGRFDTECPMEQINPAIRDLTNVPNESQGTIRYGTLNMTSFLRRVRRDFSAWKEITGSEAEWAVCMTHLNEYAHPGARNAAVKYHSDCEESYRRVEETFCIS